MKYTLRSKPKSNDFDLLEDGRGIGQVINSANGFTVYLLGDVEALLDAAPTAEAALDAFEHWAATNTMPDLIATKPSEPA